MLVRIHLSIDPLCQPMKEERVQDLGNCISSVRKSSVGQDMLNKTKKKKHI